MKFLQIKSVSTYPLVVKILLYPKLKYPNSHVPDLNLEQTGLAVLLDIHVDWEMGVDVSHLVLESLCDTNDQVVDQSSDCAEGSDILSGTVVQLDIDDLLLWVGEVDSQMAEIFGENSCPAVSPQSFNSFPDHSVPLGPSTVTFLDLMVTLTVYANQYWKLIQCACIVGTKVRH
jgi:hypothetical protein